MTLDLRIAGIRVSIKGRDFLNELSPDEKKLLHPFTVKRPSQTEASAIVHTKFVRNSPAHPNAAFLNLAESIKNSFFYKEDKRFVSFFEAFVKNNLTPYLRENTLRQKKLAALLKDKESSENSLILQEYSFVFRDKKNRRYELVRRKTDPLSEEHFLWMHNLNALKLLFRMILNSKKDGALLHASSIEQNGEGYVFIGPGNSGKSTITRMLKPARILSDDITVIRKKDRTYKIYSTPWWNAYGQKCPSHPWRPTRLKALFFIKKARKTCLEKLSYKDALRALIYGDRPFQQSVFFDNKDGIKAFYLFAQRLLDHVPAFELCVKKGRNFRAEFLKLVNSA